MNHAIKFNNVCVSVKSVNWYSMLHVSSQSCCVPTARRGLDTSANETWLNQWPFTTNWQISRIKFYFRRLLYLHQHNETCDTLCLTLGHTLLFKLCPLLFHMRPTATCQYWSPSGHISYKTVNNIVLLLNSAAVLCWECPITNSSPAPRTLRRPPIKHAEHRTSHHAITVTNTCTCTMVRANTLYTLTGGAHPFSAFTQTFCAFYALVTTHITGRVILWLRWGATW